MSTNEQMYSEIKEKIANVLRNSTGLPVQKVKYAGSRKDGTYRKDSDLDIQFSVQGDPPKSVVYPKVVAAIKLTLGHLVGVGSTGNVVNVWGKGFSIDLVLVKTSEI